MFELGANPARIIPAVQAMIERYGGRPLHYVGEPIWSGRSPEEIREADAPRGADQPRVAGRHISILCPYDIASARRPGARATPSTHILASFMTGGSTPARRTAAADGPGRMRASAVRSSAGRAQARRSSSSDLGRLRGWMADQADRRALTRSARAELVTAVNELTSNTVKHADTHGILRFWRTSDELIFQIEDSGHIADPLAGRRRRALGSRWPRPVDGQPAVRSRRGPHERRRHHDPHAFEVCSGASRPVRRRRRRRSLHKRIRTRDSAFDSTRPRSAARARVILRGSRRDRNSFRGAARG